MNASQALAVIEFGRGDRHTTAACRLARYAYCDKDDSFTTVDDWASDLSRFERTGQRLVIVILLSGLIRRTEHGGQISGEGEGR